MDDAIVVDYIRQLLAHEEKVNPTPYIKNGPNLGEILARPNLKADFTLFELKVARYAALAASLPVVLASPYTESDVPSEVPTEASVEVPVGVPSEVPSPVVVASTNMEIEYITPNGQTVRTRSAKRKAGRHNELELPIAELTVVSDVVAEEPTTVDNN